MFYFAVPALQIGGNINRVFGQAWEKFRLESGALMDVGHICELALQAWKFENQARKCDRFIVGGPPRLTSTYRNRHIEVRNQNNDRNSDG